MQCAVVYWEDTENPRTPQLHQLSEEERSNLPTENLPCERCLGIFGGLAGLSAAKEEKGEEKEESSRTDICVDHRGYRVLDNRMGSRVSGPFVMKI